MSDETIDSFSQDKEIIVFSMRDEEIIVSSTIDEEFSVLFT
jgi:hypothetical protein